MLKRSAVVQIVIVLLIIGYGTFELFRGNFEAAISTFPVIMAYYVFIIARQKKLGMHGTKDPDDR